MSLLKWKINICCFYINQPLFALSEERQQALNWYTQYRIP